jgi:hypothetical protein
VSETKESPFTALKVICIIGLGLGMTVFAGGLMIGISLDPRVDMPSRLLAYVTALGGLTVAFASRWALSTQPIERKIFTALTFLAFAFFVGYAAVML